MNNLQQHKANITDLPDIIALLADDELGKTREKNAFFIQLTTDKKRTHAKHFYEQLDFKATHEGMKYILTPDDAHKL
ncbi:MAG: hypothetical protein QNK11_08955 [Legionella sp.]|nr:hypothetical protein [Legionella sp.]